MKVELFLIGVLLFPFINCYEGNSVSDGIGGGMLNDASLVIDRSIFNVMPPFGICNENCMLHPNGGPQGEISYPVKRFYNSGGKNNETAEPRNRDWWIYDKFPRKSMGLTLKIKPICAAFSVEYSDKFQVQSFCGDRKMKVKFGTNTIEDTISNNTKTIAIGWDVLPGEEASMQVVQLNTFGQPARISPIYKMVYGDGLEDDIRKDSPVILVKNIANQIPADLLEDYPGMLEIKNVSFAVQEDFYDRAPRSVVDDVVCSDVSLAFFGYLFYDSCKALQNKRIAQNLTFYNRGKQTAVHVSGSYTEPIKIKENNKGKESSDVFTLRQLVDTGDKNPVASVVAAHNCNVLFQKVISNRIMRGLGDSATRDCIHDALDVVTPFIHLFWGRIGMMFENSDRGILGMVQRILDGKGTGQPISSNQIETETRLISAVKELTRIKRDEGHEAIKLIVDAFVVGSYWESVESQTDVSADGQRSEEEELIRTVDAATTGDLLVGQYEYDMRNFQTSETIIPRTWSGREWRETATDRFTSRIFCSGVEHPDEERTELSHLISVIGEWLLKYEVAANREDLSDEDKQYYKNAMGIASRLKLILSLLDAHKDMIVIVISFRGQLVSFFVGNVDGRNADILYSLTNPESVVPEYFVPEVSVRGAGTEAVQLFLEELKKRGVVKVRSDVISKPSAKVKLKIGFKPVLPTSGEL
ncbi:hypothetical protein [Leptospira ilyithenensis]|uniref:Uncharacterized protein n=1 Tax=Leptospira ilyithenensis TaxID=2484901 RepID=A0A4R9LUV3_9LEPT|nr:hypothetical protein [Leptospira ilyithenensis]TGN14278.1 hypothetical protein EHS11_02025 [Leptospira ilyithenensis]